MIFVTLTSRVEEFNKNIEWVLTNMKPYAFYKMFVEHPHWVLDDEILDILKADKSRYANRCLFLNHKRLSHYEFEAQLNSIDGSDKYHYHTYEHVSISMRLGIIKVIHGY